MRDLKAIGIDDWYTVCQDRERWSSLCAVTVDEVAHAERRTPAHDLTIKVILESWALPVCGVYNRH